jgi:P27 family predicted phage terminase small subunit
MATVGRKPKPALQVVREGNPGKRPVKDSVKLPPSALIEPDWDEKLPGKSAEDVRLRAIASGLWVKLAPTLSRSVGLVGEQQETLVDYCMTYARIDQGERALSVDGVVVMTERGQVKNAGTTILNGYRSHLRSLIGELGLSPSSASRIVKPVADDDEDPFD